MARNTGRTTQTLDRDAASVAQFVGDLQYYLAQKPRQLPSRYFYDELGSALFEAICRLPWYRITRAEAALLAARADDILRPMPRPVSLIELGCGSGEKLAILAKAAGGSAADVQLIDISPAALEMSRERLRALGLVSVRTHNCTYEDGLIRAARHRSPDGSLLVLF